MRKMKIIKIKINKERKKRRKNHKKRTNIKDLQE
jgi:hypothetical protein